MIVLLFTLNGAFLHVTDKDDLLGSPSASPLLPRLMPGVNIHDVKLLLADDNCVYLLDVAGLMMLQG